MCVCCLLQTFCSFLQNHFFNMGKICLGTQISSINRDYSWEDFLKNSQQNFSSSQAIPKFLQGTFFREFRNRVRSSKSITEASVLSCVDSSWPCRQQLLLAAKFSHSPSTAQSCYQTSPGALNKNCVQDIRNISAAREIIAVVLWQWWLADSQQKTQKQRIKFSLATFLPADRQS